MKSLHYVTCLAWACLPALPKAYAAAPDAPVPDAAAATAEPGARLGYAPGKPPPSWAVATAETIMTRWPEFNRAYHASWTYVHGYDLCGFERLYRDTGDRRYLDYLKRYIDQHVAEDGSFRIVPDGRGRMRETRFTNLDNMMTGNTLVFLYEETKDVRYRKAAETIRRALDDYPRNSDGGFWHSHGLTGQMWIDGIFMGQMFLTRYGKSVGDSAYAWDEATRQLLVYARRGGREGTGLYLHGVFESGHGPRPCPWADTQTGRSPEVWSEGLGWYALMLVETLDVLPKEHQNRAAVEDVLRRLADGLRRTQAANGCWFQVVDKGDRPDNWTDTSGSAMFVYTLQKGIELGLLDERTYAPVVNRGYAGITSFARINERGLVDIYQACDGVGVQVDYRHYIDYIKSLNAKEAVAGFLWATEIVERARLRQAAAK